MPNNMHIYAPVWEVLSGAEFKSLYEKGDCPCDWNDWYAMNAQELHDSAQKFHTLSWNEETKRWEVQTVKHTIGTPVRVRRHWLECSIKKSNYDDIYLQRDTWRIFSRPSIRVIKNDAVPVAVRACTTNSLRWKKPHTGNNYKDAIKTWDNEISRTRVMRWLTLGNVRPNQKYSNPDVITPYCGRLLLTKAASELPTSPFGIDPSNNLKRWWNGNTYLDCLFAETSSKKGLRRPYITSLCANWRKSSDIPIRKQDALDTYAGKNVIKWKFAGLMQKPRPQF